MLGNDRLEADPTRHFYQTGARKKSDRSKGSGRLGFVSHPTRRTKMSVVRVGHYFCCVTRNSPKPTVLPSFIMFEKSSPMIVWKWSFWIE